MSAVRLWHVSEDAGLTYGPVLYEEVGSAAGHEPTAPKVVPGPEQRTKPSGSSPQLKLLCPLTLNPMSSNPKLYVPKPETLSRTPANRAVCSPNPKPKITKATNPKP